MQDRKIIHGRLILIEQNQYFACSDVCPNHADEDQFFYVKRHAALHFLQTEGGQEYKRKKKPEKPRKAYYLRGAVSLLL